MHSSMSEWRLRFEEQIDGFLRGVILACMVLWETFKAVEFRAGTEGLHRRYAFCMLHSAMGGGPFVVATFESHIMCFFLLDLK